MGAVCSRLSSSHGVSSITTRSTAAWVDHGMHGGIWMS
jgi:hypothetical protein